MHLGVCQSCHPEVACEACERTFLREWAKAFARLMIGKRHGLYKPNTVDEYTSMAIKVIVAETRPKLGVEGQTVVVSMPRLPMIQLIRKAA